MRVSKLVKDDLNPVIEEDFEFHVKDPLGKVLRLSVYDADHQGKYDAVGHALFYLEDVIAGRPRRYAMKLYRQSQVSAKTAQVHGDGYKLFLVFFFFFIFRNLSEKSQ